ncbi:hypothetical protein [Natronocalculus amylovorans]|uniref:Uncharacterized protein n=1 Tax=Natronocalculus amylovorans TaxID=2917812 RepID=A0AAE3G1Y2_9EURY|nr:hypothetical protein [Natronocalculus amylovorans]MCL9818314.1 hypothetical protein [Natronocalculus amylovorans]
MPGEWHPQDWIIVLSALIKFENEQMPLWKRERIEYMIQEISYEQGLEPTELINQAVRDGRYLEVGTVAEGNSYA